MGKTYIETVKYLIHANIEIDGLVEKPDVVGAIFGQTEGLLGDELDLRDLQKNGRIGRIEVDLQEKGGKSVGKIKIPSSLDMVETSILAASLETVDRVGPCEARIVVEKVEDTRNIKRKELIERAKKLLREMLIEEIPESREISEQVRVEVKASEICEYGPEKLPCGPGIDRYDSIILVEGRADVINLLKNDITNVIAIGGANITETIANLCRKKEVTVFLDGDRGGDIILRELASAAEIDFVARAPKGKEVEELSRKEVIKCLRAKVPYEQENSIKEGLENGKREDVYKPSYQQAGSSVYERYREGHYEKKLPYRRRREADVPAVTQTSSDNSSQEMQETEERGGFQPSEVPEVYIRSLDELENTLRARFYNDAKECIREIPVRDIIKSLEEETEVSSVVFDGIVTQRLAEMAENKGVKFLVGVKMGNVFRRPTKTLIYTKT
ncbi:MAG: DNA primase DnaG [Candidatus Anstonellales archaeon]